MHCIQLAYLNSKINNKIRHEEKMKKNTEDQRRVDRNVNNYLEFTKAKIRVSRT